MKVSPNYSHKSINAITKLSTSQQELLDNINKPENSYKMLMKVIIVSYFRGNIFALRPFTNES